MTPETTANLDRGTDAVGVCNTPSVSITLKRKKILAGGDLVANSVQLPIVDLEPCLIGHLALECINLEKAMKNSLEQCKTDIKQCEDSSKDNGKSGGGWFR